MSLPVPNLDDRSWKQIVDEAVRLIPRYCPEWTNHNASDPGVTLLELYAWMTEMVIYRLNKVPEKNFLTFLDLIGVRLKPPEAAKVVLEFTPADGIEGALGRPGTDRSSEATRGSSGPRIPPLPEWQACDGKRWRERTPNRTESARRRLFFARRAGTEKQIVNDVEPFGIRGRLPEPLKDPRQ